MDSKKIDQIADDVDGIKKFLIIDLVSRGFSQEDVDSLIGASQSWVSKLFPGGMLKKAANLRKNS